jgi:2-polyprenyl-6-methoxyphenol hydroxylase-like FAD-dependent oxidoreductase
MSPTAEHTDVLVVGAGAAGLTLAIDLARRGVDFRLIDKAQASFEGSRGKGIQPRSLEVYEDLGVLPALMALGAAPYPVTRTYGEGGFVDEAMSEDRAPTPAEPFSRPLMLPQMLTERALRGRLAELGHAPDFGCELLAFEDGAGGIAARLRTAGGEKLVRASWMVGADGGRSLVRHALGVGFPGKTLPIRALVGDLKVAGLSRDAWHRWMGGTEGQLALCPLAGTDLFQLQAVLTGEGDPDLSREGLAAMIARRTRREDLAVEAVTWASPFGMNARLADPYRVGHVLLAGDAAHVHPPTGGQGLNTSVQDAYNLGWKLAAVLAGAPERLIDTYEAERRPIAAGVLGLSEALLSAAKANDMRRGRETQELDLSYAASSLAIDLRGEPGRVTAGDRAPDAPCGAARLFDLFAGPHWTLIGWRVGGARVAAREGLKVVTDLSDPDGHFAGAYGLAPGTWILIRPDGYVGLIAPAGREAPIAGYLDEVMPATVAA